MEERRFTLGLALFLAGVVWNIYYSALSWQEAIGNPYGIELMCGGMLAAIGLLLMVAAWRGGPGTNGKR